MQEERRCLLWLTDIRIPSDLPKLIWAFKWRGGLYINMGSLHDAIDASIPPCGCWSVHSPHISQEDKLFNLEVGGWGQMLVSVYIWCSTWLIAKSRPKHRNKGSMSKKLRYIPILSKGTATLLALLSWKWKWCHGSDKYNELILSRGCWHIKIMTSPYLMTVHQFKIKQSRTSA